MPNALDQRLASRIHQQWITTLGRVDTITRAVGVVYNRLERELLGLLAAGSPDAVSQAARSIDATWAAVGRLVRSRFEELAVDAHKRTVGALRGTIPPRWFAAVEPRLAFTERSDSTTRDTISCSSNELERSFDKCSVPFTEQLTDEPVYSKLTDEEKRKLFEEAIFPPPTAEQVEQYLTTPGPGGMTWNDRLAYWEAPTREKMLGEMLAGAAEGEPLNLLRKRILPLIDGIRYKAQRIVRTEGRRVAERANMTAYDQCGDLIGSMQIIATLDARTRPAHAIRHGKIYDKQADGTYQAADGEVLPDLPDAANCRCFASPVLAPIPEIEANPAIRTKFTNAQADVVADPAAYSRWFDRATEAERATVVGVSRYRAVTKRAGKLFGRRSEWEDFLGKRGELLPLGTLKRQGQTVWLRRRLAVAELIGDREQLVATILAG